MASYPAIANTETSNDDEQNPGHRRSRLRLDECRPEPSAAVLALLLALPHAALFNGGCLLFPIAIFMAVLARQSQPRVAGPVIAGNVAWVLDSLAVLILTEPNTLGVGFLGSPIRARAGLGRVQGRWPPGSGRIGR